MAIPSGPSHPLRHMPPTMPEARPAATAMRAADVRVAVEASALIDVPAERLLPWFVPRSPVGLFPSWGPIPGVVAIRDQHGAWTMPGARRVLVMSDGSHTQETVLAFQPPTRFAYRMSGFSGLLARLAHAIEGEWRVVPCGPACCAVTWRYSFADRGRFARVALRLMCAVLWRGYLQAGLGHVRAAAEAECGAPPEAVASPFRWGT